MRLLLLIVLASGAVRAAAPPSLPLWPNGVPGEAGSVGEEHDATKPSDAVVAGRRLIRLTDVSAPSMTVYRALGARHTGAAVVVFPGGGYNILAYDLEGTEVCEWLNSIGVTAVLVKYRVPRRKGKPLYAAPLQDAQRALGLVRSHAAAWGINPHRIGVLGFSAGGHLSAAVSNNFAARTYPAVDGSDGVDCRPDFTVMVYPAYLNDETQPDHVAPELHVTATTPPTFIVQTEDDKSFVPGTLIYYRELLTAKVPAELHLYTAGGHGYGLRPSPNPVSGWPKLVEQWLRGLGVLGAQ